MTNMSLEVNNDATQILEDVKEIEQSKSASTMNSARVGSFSNYFPAQRPFVPSWPEAPPVPIANLDADVHSSTNGGLPNQALQAKSRANAPHLMQLSLLNQRNQLLHGIMAIVSCQQH